MQSEYYLFYCHFFLAAMLFINSPYNCAWFIHFLDMRFWSLYDKLGRCVSFPSCPYQLFTESESIVILSRRYLAIREARSGSVAPPLVHTPPPVPTLAVFLAKTERFNIWHKIRGDVKIHNCWLQPKCCRIQKLCIAFPI